VRETENLVEQQPPQIFFVYNNAGLVINKLSPFSSNAVTVGSSRAASIPGANQTIHHEIRVLPRASEPLASFLKERLQFPRENDVDDEYSSVLMMNTRHDKYS